MWGEKPWRPKTIPDWAQVSSDSIEHLCRLPLHRNGDHWSWFQLSAAQLAEHWLSESQGSAQMWQWGHVAGLHRASTNLLCKRYFRTPMHRNWLINVNYSSTPEDSVSKILLEVHGEFISTLVQCRARMTSSFTGRFWCMVNEGNSPQTVEARLGTVGVCIKIGHPMKISRFTKFTHIEYEFSPK